MTNNRVNLSRINSFRTRDFGLVSSARETLAICVLLIASVVMPMHILGSGISDISLVWMYPTDLMSWYLRALAYLTTDSSHVTTALGYPGTYDSGLGGVLSLDGVQSMIQYLVTHISQSPIVGTNVMLLSQFSLTAILAYALARAVGVGRILSLAGALSITLLPFSFERLANPNIAFAWPYVSALLAILLIGRASSGRWVNTTVVVLGILLSASGAYAICFSFFAILIPGMIAISISVVSGQRRRILALSALFVSALMIGLVGQYALTMSDSGREVRAPVRSSGEALDFQGYNFSLFLPSRLSGIEPVAHIGQDVFDGYLKGLDEAMYCSGSPTLPKRDLMQEIGCSVVSERLAAPPILGVLGAIAVVCLSTFMFFRRSRRSFKSQVGRAGPSPARLFISTWWATVLLSSFGLGLAVNMAIPAVRVWTRVMPVAVCAGIFVTLLVLDRIARRGRLAEVLAGIAVIGLVVLDQGGMSIPTVQDSRSEQQFYRAAAVAMSHRLNENCPVLVLPSRRLPTTPIVQGASYVTYADALPALYAPTLRWSGGAGATQTDPPDLNVSGDPDLWFDAWKATGEYLVKKDFCGFLSDGNSGAAVAGETFALGILDTAIHDPVRKRNIIDERITEGKLTGWILSPKDGK